MTDEERAAKAEYARRWNAANPGKAAASCARYRAKNSEARRASERARASNQEALREVLAKRPRPQNCELCGKSGDIVFDHCHDSSRFRGWICNFCNLALGLVKDDLSILRKMIAYLETDLAESSFITEEHIRKLKLSSGGYVCGARSKCWSPKGDSDGQTDCTGSASYTEVAVRAT